MVCMAYNISVSDVRKAIEVKRTTQSENSISLNIKGRTLQLFAYFKAFQAGSGVLAAVSKAKAMFIPHAFIQTARQGNNPGWRGVMVRKGDTGYQRPPGSHKRKKPESHIHGLQGPSIPALVNVDKIAGTANQKALDHLQEEFEAEVDRRLRA